MNFSYDIWIAGILRKAEWLFLSWLLILCYMISMAHADLPDNQLEAPLVSPTSAPLATPALPDLPLPSNLPLYHRRKRKHPMPSHVPKRVLAPSQPPDYGPLVTSAHPPTSSRLSKPSMKRGGLASPGTGLVPPHLEDIAPMQSNAGPIPVGLAQPPLSPSDSSKTYFLSILLLQFSTCLVICSPWKRKGSILLSTNTLSIL